MKPALMLALTAAALCIPLGGGVSIAQERPIACEYDPNLAGIRCFIYESSLTIDNITINDGKCRVWDHRLLKDSLGDELRGAGKIPEGSDYSDAELDIISAAIVDKFRERRFSRGDFLRFEPYRCKINNISIETPLGTYTLAPQN